MGAIREDMAVVEVMQKVGTNEDGQSALATPDGRSRKKKSSPAGELPLLYGGLDAFWAASQPSRRYTH